MKVLVTGGSGYIGSHTCVQLLQQGHEVVILDNLCNSKRSVLPVIERLGGKEATFIEGDIRNEALMTEILHDHAIEAVIHFAGLKAVGESVAKPLEYYDNNVTGTLKLVSAMRAAGVKNFIFSSSATVYGDQPKIPYVESFPTGTPQSPYGKSKADGGADPDRPAESPAGVEHCPAALLQPGRRPPVGRYGGRPAGDPEQPDALHRPGRRWPSRIAGRFW